MSEGKKKFKDTKIGGWIRSNAPKVLDVVGDALPDKGVLGIVKNLIDSDPDISPEQRMEFMRLLQQEMSILDQEISNMWGSDMSSASWLSKNVRPLTLLSLLVFIYVIIIFDSIDRAAFSVGEGWISMLSSILGIVIVAYFGARTYEKKGIEIGRKK